MKQLKFKEIQEETAKDSSLMRIARYITVASSLRRDPITVKKIKNALLTIRITEIIRNNIGPWYNSREFKKFAKNWRFQHIPRSNGPDKIR